jgi:hypothetical protein
MGKGENMRKYVSGVFFALLASGACDVTREEYATNSCELSRRECRIRYSTLSGYGRYCGTATAPCDLEDVEDEDTLSDEKPAESPEAAAPVKSDSARPAAAAPLGDRGIASPEGERYSAFEFPCVRDSQCGPGKCTDGQCYYGCQSDEQCGSGDRCSVESGLRICLPDPNPVVQCTRTAQCDDGAVCLNGTCRQSCTGTEQCTNGLDRCAVGICQPDRRPLAECVLSSECRSGFVCLDGSCVAECPPGSDGEVCLAGPIGGAPNQSIGDEPNQSVGPVLNPPSVSVDAGVSDEDEGDEDEGDEDEGDEGDEPEEADAGPPPIRDIE